MSTTHQVVHTLRVQPRPELGSGLDGRLRDRIREATGLAVEAVRVHKLYEVVGAVAPGVARWVGEALLADPVAEAVEAGLPSAPSGGWSVQVGYRPGVTDNEGRTAEDLLACAARAGRVAVPGEVAIHASRLYELDGPLDEAAVRRIATEVLGNPLVQRFAVAAPGTALAPGWWREPVGAATPAEPVRTHVLPDDDAALAAFSREAVLALTAEELQAVRRHFARPEVLAARAAGGLPALPTDVELEAIAQTWSEHCKHKIFNDSIRLETPDGVRVLDAGLFKAHIRAATEQVATERDWLVSVFEDNAGVIRFVPGHHLVFKVETHNAPSALEPYGGALTGIVGVNRDPAATGLGARLIFNTDVFCFAPPDTPPPYPPGVLPPRRIFEGVRRGVEDGGNQSGVPTVNGALFFDPRFLGRPLVFCGTGALMDETVAGRPGHEKAIEPGDLVVMAGGRVGLDGIHGATFSSDAVGAEAPAGVVQIGDPITQKKLLDMLAEAREQGLFRAITDNGAGGLSSSVGELARLCGGASLALDRVPLKYPGLAPWQVLVSESQERMTLAVPPEHWPALQALAARRDVEVAAIGAFTENGLFAATWHGRPVMGLALDFLHDGLPRRTLPARWPREAADPGPPPAPPTDWNVALLALLGSLNVCSREAVIRQYDHEVQAATVVKPLVGVAAAGPSDAAVLRPLPDRVEGVVVACALNPHVGDRDPHAMAQLVVDEAIRNAVAVGADPDHLALLDNFCWPDPVYDPVKNPDGREKLGALVRTCEGLHEAVVGFAAPLVSGKDSVKNDYHGPDGKLSVPPTLLVSAIARHPDIRLAVTMDAKVEGDLVYVLGVTADELGGSQYAWLRGWRGGDPPRVDVPAARARYRRLHAALMAGLVASCHDCSEGGLAVALAETAFAGGLGMAIDLARLPEAAGLSAEALLFAESASRLVVTVNPAWAGAFEAAMAGEAVRVGHVTAEPCLRLGCGDATWIDVANEALEGAWRRGLTW